MLTNKGVEKFLLTDMLDIKRFVYYNANNVSMSVNVDDKTFDINGKEIDLTSGMKYLKGVFTNKERFIDRFINTIVNAMEKNLYFDATNFENVRSLIDLYDTITPYSYEEAFLIEDRDFQIVVFGSININEMIKHLGHTRIKTDGKTVKQKVFSKEGEFLRYEEIDNIYEIHEIDPTKLGVNNGSKLYALKCWCTTTNKEHWIFIDEKYKDSPLEAVASTFWVYDNMIPYIKEIKRQGDVLLVEWTKPFEKGGKLVPLTAEIYFKHLTCQT